MWNEMRELCQGVSHWAICATTHTGMRGSVWLLSCSSHLHGSFTIRQGKAAVRAFRVAFSTGPRLSEGMRKPHGGCSVRLGNGPRWGVCAPEIGVVALWAEPSPAPFPSCAVGAVKACAWGVSPLCFARLFRVRAEAKRKKIRRKWRNTRTDIDGRIYIQGTRFLA